jgi:hypothetical protein
MVQKDNPKGLCADRVNHGPICATSSASWKNIKEIEMVILTGTSHRCLRMLVAMLTMFVAWNANAANTADSLPVRAALSPYCQQTFSKVRSPPAKSDSRYGLLLLFDASAMDAVHGFFHTVPADPVHRKPAQDGCVKDPDQSMETPKGGKPIGIVVQGSCPTDCVDPPPRVKPPADVKAPADNENPLGNNKWGIFSADDGSDTQFLVWQILASDATHASRVLASLKQDSNFPKAAYRGNLVIGYHDPRSPHTPEAH